MDMSLSMFWKMVKNKEGWCSIVHGFAKSPTRLSHWRIRNNKEWISELEDKTVEITAEDPNKEKWMKRIEDSLRELWDSNKFTNIGIIGDSEEEEDKKTWENFWRD